MQAPRLMHREWHASGARVCVTGGARRAAWEGSTAGVVLRQVLTPEDTWPVGAATCKRDE